MFPMLMLSLGFLNLVMAPVLATTDSVKAELDAVRVEATKGTVSVADIKARISDVIASLDALKTGDRDRDAEIERLRIEAERWFGRIHILLDPPGDGTAETLRAKLLGGHSRDESPPSPGYLDIMADDLDRLAGGGK